MLVLSWIVLILSALFALSNLLGVIVMDSGKKRLMHLFDVVFFAVIFVTTFWNIFY